MLDELKQRMQDCSRELAAAKRDIEKCEKREQRESKHQQRKAWRSTLIRIIGFKFKSCRSFPAAFSQKTDVEEQRERSRRKSKQRFTNLAAKELRTSRLIQQSHSRRDLGSKPK